MGVLKYHIITIGCQMNKSDSERIAAYLEEGGFVLAKTRNEADVVILTTCGVRQSAEDRIYGLVPEIKKTNPQVKIVISGCLSERKDVIKRLKKKVDVWLPIIDLKNLFTLLGFANKIRQEKNYLNYIPKYSSPNSAFVPIGNGCDNFCSYCVVPFARHREVYRDSDEIIQEIKNLLSKGYREIVLIAQNVNSYFCKKEGVKFDFADLLCLVNDLPGSFRFSFATSHPKDMSDKLIKTIFKLDKLLEHLHLPVQSGDDQILRSMNRNYTVKRYKNLLKKIRKEYAKSRQNRLDNWLMPLAITTDIIVGYPGETKAQFENTRKLMEEVGFDMAYIAKYSPRPYTAATKLKDDVSPEEKKKREKILENVLRKSCQTINQKYLNKSVEVFVEKKKAGIYYGKTRTAKTIKIKNSSSGAVVGTFRVVKIIKITDFGLEGNLLDLK